MAEDSSGAHTPLALQISRQQVPHTQRLLSMAQVRLALTSFILFPMTRGICIDASPKQLDWMDLVGHLRGDRRSHRLYNNRNKSSWGGQRVLLFPGSVQRLVDYPCKLLTADESKSY